MGMFSGTTDDDDLRVDEALAAETRNHRHSTSKITNVDDARSYVWALHEQGQMDPLPLSEAYRMYPRFNDAIDQMISRYGLDLDHGAVGRLWVILAQYAT